MFRGRVQTVMPSIVVTDTPELIVSWIPLNTSVMTGVSGSSTDTDGRDVHLIADLLVKQNWKMVRREWHTAGTLRLKTPNALWSLWLFWDSGMTNLRSWYINIDAPFRRTRFGFDTWDMFLDVVVAPDRKSWRYKDEDEFAEAIAAGIFTAREAAEVRATAQKALEIVKSNRPPFNTIWERWRPDVLWDVPGLPGDWEIV